MNLPKTSKINHVGMIDQFIMKLVVRKKIAKCKQCENQISKGEQAAIVYHCRGHYLPDQKNKLTHFDDHSETKCIAILHVDCISSFLPKKSDEVEFIYQGKLKNKK